MIILFSLMANLGLAFIAYYALEIELHLYALAGITVSFGIVIDNSIIMMHHIKKQGNLRVFPALLAATLTTIAALIIVFFLPEKWRINLLDFAKVIGINLSVSLLVALWLIPAMMQQFKLDRKHLQYKGMLFRKKRRIMYWKNCYKNLLTFLLSWRKTAVLFIILIFGFACFLAT